MATILVVDDEMGIRALLQEILSDEGHSVELAENAAAARAYRDRQRPDLVLLDIWMPDVDGITLLKEWGSNALLNMPVIMMSGHGTIDTAVEAAKFGATSFLEKPITLQKLLRAVDQALVKPAPSPVPTLSSVIQPLSAAVALPGTPGPLPAAIAPLNGGLEHRATAPLRMEALSPASPNVEQSFSLDRPLREARDAFEKAYFEFHLARENGSMTRVAERTGLERTHLYRKLKQLGVDLSRTKRGAQ
jgi:DNA-binding NtrC family response regulator